MSTVKLDPSYYKENENKDVAETTSDFTMFSKRQLVAVYSTMMQLVGYGSLDSIRTLDYFIEETKPVFSSRAEANNLSKGMTYRERGELLCVDSLSNDQIEKIKYWWADCLRIFRNDYSCDKYGRSKIEQKIETLESISMENGIFVLDIAYYL